VAAGYANGPHQTLRSQLNSYRSCSPTELIPPDIPPHVDRRKSKSDLSNHGAPQAMENRMVLPLDLNRSPVTRNHLGKHV
jgi:hypothetical protein